MRWCARRRRLGSNNGQWSDEERMGLPLVRHKGPRHCGWHSEGMPLLQIGDVMRARGGSVALWMGRVPGRCYSKQGDGHICRGCRQLPPEMKNKIPSARSPASRIAIHMLLRKITQGHMYYVPNQAPHTTSRSNSSSIPMIHTRASCFLMKCERRRILFRDFDGNAKQFFGRFFTHFFSRARPRASELL